MFAKDGSDKSDRRPQSASSGDAPLSIIAVGTLIKGDLESNGVIKVEGRIEGSIRGARQVLLGRQGEIKGDIQAHDAVIGGKIEGRVQTTERVEVQGTATVNGDIHTKTIIVLEGARINGQVRMSDGTVAGDVSTPVGVAIVR